MSADGSVAASLAVGTNPAAGEVLVFDLRKNVLIDRFHSVAVGLSADGSLIALATPRSGGKINIEIRDVRTKKLIASKVVSGLLSSELGAALNRHHGNAFGFVDDSTLGYFASTRLDPVKPFHVWNFKKGEDRILFKSSLPYGAQVAIRPDLGSVLVSSTNGIRKYRLADGAEPLAKLRRPNLHVAAADLAADGSALAIAGGADDGVADQIFLVDPASGAVKRTFSVPKDPGGSELAVASLKFLPDSRAILLNEFEPARRVGYALRQIRLLSRSGQAVDQQHRRIT